MADHRLQIVLAAKDITGTAFKKFQGSIAAMARSVFSLRGAFASLTGAAGIGLLVKATVSAASDLQEVTGKYNVVFGDLVKNVDVWANHLVDSYAMSTREAKKFLSEMQDLLVPMGMDADAAANMSNNVVKLAADLGSFNNLRTKDVMRDIQSALVGNFETMKKYGVVLNQAVINQKALDLGLIRTKSELTATKRAQVAYKLIVEGSKFAIGDMARTSGDYANQLKKAKANIEDVTAALGISLLPKVNEVITGFNGWIKENQKLIQQDIPGYLAEIASGLANIAKYAGLRSVMGTFTEGADLAAQGLIDWNKFVTASFLERQKMVDAAIEQMKTLGMVTGKINQDTPGFGAYSQPDFTTGGGFGGDPFVPKKEKIGNDPGATSIPRPGGVFGVVDDYSDNFADLWDASFADMTKSSEDAYESMSRHVYDYEKESKKAFENINQSTDALAYNMTDALANFALNGKMSFKSFADSLISDLIRIQSRMLITKLFTSIGGMAGGGTSAAGGIGGATTYSAADIQMASGGYIGENVAGIGMQSGKSYQFHKNEVVLPVGGSGNPGSGNQRPIVVYNITAMDSQSVHDALKRSGAVPILAAENLGDNGMLRQAMLENM